MKDICILHVEDEDSDVELLQFAFKKAGIQSPLHNVTDAQQAMDYLSGTGSFADRVLFPLPHLILLDLKLPNMTGLDLLAWIRRQSNLKSLVIIILSSSGQPSDIERAYELGANSFIQKPADFQTNLQMVQLLKAWWLDLNCFAPLS